VACGVPYCVMQIEGGETRGVNQMLHRRGMSAHVLTGGSKGGLSNFPFGSLFYHSHASSTLC
jgi:hypothetical protein